jgi:dienelactone hydrolase
MNGRATRKIVEIIVKRKDREHIFPLYVFIPNGAEKKPVPVILTLDLRRLTDADPARAYLSASWPAEMIVARGYAAAAVRTHDIAPDYIENFTTKFHRLFPECVSDRPADAWGCISAWAWGMSRAIDYLVTDPSLNGKEIAITGLSRAGKTSLWCGAQDPRVAMVISAASGCSGAPITRGKAGEHIKDIAFNFPYWFCHNYKKYADNEDVMPFDQHFLLGLIAPRPLYLSERTLDSWIDPRAEYESLKQAAKVYKLYDKTIDLPDTMPGPEEGIISGNLGFHMKSGEHNMEEYDWERYLDFCDRHFHPARKT